MEVALSKASLTGAGSVASADSDSTGLTSLCDPTQFSVGRNMIFVCGVPRSGTTLMQRILGNHSQVYAGPEFDFVPQIVQRWRGDMRASVSSGRIAPIVNHEGLDKAFRAFLSTIFLEKLNAGPQTVFCEKTPATALVLDDLITLLPKARFVMMVRDPVEVVNSMRQVKTRQLAKCQRPARFIRSLAGSVELYNQYMDAALPTARIHDQIKLSYYADLVANPETEVRRVCKHVGLPFEPSMLKIEDAESSLPKMADETWYSHEEQSKPICASGVVTKKLLLSKDEVAMVKAHVKKWPELERFDLSDAPLSLKQYLLWSAERAKVHGVLLPRKQSRSV